MQELTSQLILLKWIIEHTYINNDSQITNNELKDIFYKEFPNINDLGKEINLLIGSFLKYVYGNKLIKFETSPLTYNISTRKKATKEIFIKNYNGLKTFTYYDNNK